MTEYTSAEIIRRMKVRSQESHVYYYVAYLMIPVNKNLQNRPNSILLKGTNPLIWAAKQERDYYKIEITFWAEIPESVALDPVLGRIVHKE